MLELQIVRHAKSDWGTQADSDHERPLSKRGLRAAGKMGSFLASAGRVADAAVCSSALRAKTTAEIFLEAAQAEGHATPTLAVRPELYGASIEDWLHIASQAFKERSPTRLMIAGHEPTCSAVLHTLTGASARFPTGAVAIVRVEDPRQLAAPESHRAHSRLEAFLIPRLLD